MNENICQYCTEEFLSVRYDAKYCSSSCRQAAHRRKKKGETADTFLIALESLPATTRNRYKKNARRSAQYAEAISSIFLLYGYKAAALAIVAAAHLEEKDNA